MFPLVDHLQVALPIAGLGCRLGPVFPLYDKMFKTAHSLKKYLMLLSSTLLLQVSPFLPSMRASSNWVGAWNRLESYSAS
jgi:hypothetical protein